MSLVFPAEISPFQSLYRGGVLTAALLLLVGSIWNSGLSAATLGAAMTVSGLVLLARLVPVAWTRERPLTFTASLVFASTLWMGAEAAALGVLLACLLHARFGQKLGDSRGYVRFQGAQLALSAFLSSAALRLAGARFGLPASGAPPLNLLAAATLGVLAFLAANGLLTAGAHLNTLRSRWQLSRSRGRLFALALVYLLGMLPVVLLAPLGATLGLKVGLPLLLLLTLSGQVARLTLEVASLRGQLETAEAMGRASIADPETDIDPSALLQRFLTLAQGLVTAERALVWTMNQETGELTPAAALPDSGVFAGQKAMFGEGLIGHAAARIRPRLVADAARDPRRGRRETASGAWLLYPIIVHARLLGVAHWIRPVSHPFTQADVARLASLVPQAAVALENVLVREQMHSQAATDGLTGLWNHRRMQELLAEEVRRSARYHRALSVLMLDVDSFKTFNDTYGHPQGDQLLRSIATILRANVRTVDHVGRYGGEEFVIILPETAKDDACRLAERIRSAVEAQACIVIDDQIIRRTISVGVAAYPEDALNPGELVQRADEALYRAKRSGKNCVIWA
jgi:diguanylate cyclase (GGDEF)-like protein